MTRRAASLGLTSHVVVLLFGLGLGRLMIVVILDIKLVPVGWKEASE